MCYIWGSRAESRWRVTANGGRPFLLSRGGTQNHVFLTFWGYSTWAARAACSLGRSTGREGLWESQSSAGNLGHYNQEAGGL